HIFHLGYFCKVLINIHCHQQAHATGVLTVENVHFGQSAPAFSPWQSVGIHPWYFQAAQLKQATAWLHDMAARPETVAIGEAGLDKAIELTLDAQIPAFKRCAEIAETLQKPLILHCVRAYAEIIAWKKSWQPAQPWIIHGFDKHPQTAAMLLQAGCYLSFGAALLRENSRAGASLRATPPDRFFLETDAADVEIKTIYDQAARLRGIDPEVLEKQLENNWAQVFGPTT
ncbi:MAG: TatD family hydrolase, partial [Saprospiraceae bacterium]|nr:TatD family hydrolase [Saprospiraceae bacterium]